MNQAKCQLAYRLLREQGVTSFGNWKQIMKNKMTFFFVSIGALAILSTAIYVINRPVHRWVGFYVWKIIAGEAHGGQYVNINNVEIYYETYGAGPPVLVLHGGLGSIQGMSDQIRALASSHFVVAADSRGHGRSTDSDAPLSYSLMSDDMLKLLDYLQLDRVDIVGWSDGGIIGLDLAMRHPERVRRLVAISANYDLDGLLERPTLDADIPRAPLRYRLLARDPAHWPALYRKVVTMWETQPHYTLNDLGHIKARTLVMAGEFDIIKREHTDQLARAIPGAQKVIIKGGTHTAVFDEARVVNDYIQRFLMAD
jgi:pimeloyl-ACP methyl ester carboxylesterase